MTFRHAGAREEGGARPHGVGDQPLVGRGDVSDAAVVSSPSGYPGLLIDLEKAAGQRMSSITPIVSGQRLAFLLDGLVLSAPTVHGTIGSSFQIQGSFDPEEARYLAAVLRNPLPTAIRFETLREE